GGAVAAGGGPGWLSGDAGARGGRVARRHRLGRAAEGGVLAARPVHHVAPDHRVDRHRARRREHARRPGRPERFEGCDRERELSRGRSAAVRRRQGGRTRRGRSVPFAPGMSWDIAVIGAGYVGVPLAHTFAEVGQRVVLVDVVPELVDALNRGESHIDDVPSEALKPLVESGAIAATTDYAAAREADAILIAVPTPLSPQREPDLSYIESAARSLAPHLREGQLVVLEST